MMMMTILMSSYQLLWSQFHQHVDDNKLITHAIPLRPLLICLPMHFLHPTFFFNSLVTWILLRTINTKNIMLESWADSRKLLQSFLLELEVQCCSISSKSMLSAESCNFCLALLNHSDLEMSQKIWLFHMHPTRFCKISITFFSYFLVFFFFLYCLERDTEILLESIKFETQKISEFIFLSQRNYD